MTEQTKAKVSDWLIPNATVFIASGCIMILELVAGRIVSQHLGQSLYTWTSIIGIVLAGISIGNYIGGRMADRFRPVQTLAVMFIVASASALTIPGLNALMGAWTWMWQQSWPVRIVIHILVTFLVPSTVLGTISPLVAKMALTKSTHTGRTIGDVYAWGAAGSIVGTFLAGFYLVAAMGTIAVVLTVSAVLAVLGVLYGTRFWAAYAWLILCGAFLYLGLGGGAPALAVGTKLGLREVHDESVVYFNESQYNRIVVKEVTPGVRAMYLDKLVHSETNLANPLDLHYDYTKIYTSVTDTFAPTGTPVRAMVIGGGGFVYPHYLELTRPGSHIEVSEIDPAVTEAAFEAFGLPRDTELKIFNMDARNHVNDLLNRRIGGEEVAPFDFIYGDSINDFSVPYHLTTKDFNEELNQLLSDDGLYLLNMIDMEDVGLFLGSVVTTCRQTFPHVYAFSCHADSGRRDTFVVVCSKQERDMEAVYRMLQDRFSFGGRLLSDEQVDRIAERAGMVLTDRYAPVENLLAVMMKSDKGEAPQKHLLEGERHARAGRLEAALQHLNRALELNPGNPVVAYNLALVHAESGDPRQAYDYYLKTLEADPDHIGALNNMAIMQAQAGRVDAAISMWNRTLEIDPYHPEAHDNLGIAMAQRGRMTEAVEHWEVSLAGAPQNAATHNNLGIAYSMQKDMTRAAEYYRAALSLNPAYPEAHCNLGDALTALGDTGEAAAHYHEALRLQPGMPGAQAGLEALARANP